MDRDEAKQDSRDAARLHLTGHEVSFDPDDLIVSKTDLRGIITYANQIFMQVSGYKESELLGKPHNLIRHPHMPRCVFRFLWDTIAKGDECFAYVVNRAKNGDHYWVFAHVTPTFDEAGKIAGYHSSRRVPKREAVSAIKPIYAALLQEEQRLGGRAGMEAAFQLLVATLQGKGVGYDQFVLGL